MVDSRRCGQVSVLFYLTDNGWTDDNTAVEWFREVFIPHAVARNHSGKRILLTFDGHHSHDTPDILLAAFDNNILLYCLPPKTTHKLQPLDVGVFGPLQSAWAKHAQQRAAEHNPITHDTVVHEYMHICLKYMTVKSITSAFRRSGMWPIDSTVFNEQDFAPSLHSSTQVSGPPSYPPHIPSSPFSGRATSLTDAEWVVTEPHTPSSSSDVNNESTTLVSNITMHLYCANVIYRRQMMNPLHLS